MANPFSKEYVANLAANAPKKRQQGVYYDESEQRYKMGLPMTTINISDATMAAKSPQAYATMANQRAQNQWETTYEPKFQEYNDALQRELQTAYDRSLAEAQGRLGYGLSMTGSGEGGLAEASRMQLQQEAAKKRMDIQDDYTKRVEAAYYQFMQTKDAQAFEMAKMAAQYNYQKQLAEMNEPSWWESLGGIVGMGAAIFGNPFAGMGGGWNSAMGSQMNSLAPTGMIQY